MNKLIVILVVVLSLMGLGPVSAEAQLAFSPQVGVSRREDVLAKQAEGVVYHSIKLGKYWFVRGVQDSPAEIVFVKGYTNRIDAALNNLLTNRWQVYFLRGGENSVVKKEKDRTVYKETWTELDQIRRRDGLNSYSGDVSKEVERAALGPNSLMSRTETVHLNHNSVFGFIKTSDKSRNFLNDGIRSLVLDSPVTDEEKGKLLLMMKKHGYYCEDPETDRKLEALLKQQQAPQLAQSQQATGETVRDSETMEDRKVDHSKLDAPKVEFSVGGRSVEPNFEINIGQKLMIRHPGEFEVTVKRYGQDRSSDIFVYNNKVKEAIELTAGNSLLLGQRYTVVVEAGGQIRAVATFVVRQGESS